MPQGPFFRDFLQDAGGFCMRRTRAGVVFWGNRGLRACAGFGRRDSVVGVAGKQQTRLTGRRRTIGGRRYPCIPPPPIGPAWPHSGPANGITAIHQNPRTTHAPARHAIPAHQRKNPRGLAGGFVVRGCGLVGQPTSDGEPDNRAGDDACD